MTFGSEESNANNCATPPADIMVAGSSLGAAKIFFI